MKAKFSATTAAEMFLTLPRWGFLNEIKGAKEKLVSIMAVRGNAFYKSTRKYGVFEKPLTQKKFYEICEAEGITVHSNALPHGKRGSGLALLESTRFKLYGFYAPTIKAIWLSPKIKGRHLLEVMGHELSHHFCHREDLISGKVKSSTYTTSATYQRNVDWLAEMEADLFMCVFLARKGGVK